MNILFSTSAFGIAKIKSQNVDGHALTVSPRSSDWGLRKQAKYIHHVREAFLLARKSRHYDALVLCTTSIETFIVARLKHILCPKTNLICFDFLIPRQSTIFNKMSPWLTLVDAFACIRTGDILTLERRFGVPKSKCHFVVFPVSEHCTDIPAEEDYIYSAGWAHRDWPTLIKALSTLPYRSILSMGIPVSIPEHAQSCIEVLPLQSPEVGRQLMAKAKLVVLSLEDTDLPSGPLVLLDALAMGKAVVATDVNGTRDYVVHGKTALLVPPLDSVSMAAAIKCLMEDSTVRYAIGMSAKHDVTMQFTSKQTLQGIVQICTKIL